MIDLPLHDLRMRHFEWLAAPEALEALGGAVVLQLDHVDVGVHSLLRNLSGSVVGDEAEEVGEPVEGVQVRARGVCVDDVSGRLRTVLVVAVREVPICSVLLVVPLDVPEASHVSEFKF